MTALEEHPFDPDEQPPVVDVYVDDYDPARHGPAPETGVDTLIATNGHRVPPHDLEAEESLLGAMLLSGSAASDAAAAGIDPSDFYKPAHATLCAAIYRLTEAGDPVDVVTVAAELTRLDLLDHVGGRKHLLELQANTPASANAPAYARVVHSHAVQRRILDLSGQLTDAVYRHDPTEGVLGQLQQLANPMAAAAGVLDRVSGGTTFLLDDPDAELEPRWGTRGGEIAWARGEPLLIVGPTGVGKTTIAGQLVAGLLGVRAEVLGLPIEPAHRVGYLALDRPRQIMRALRRCFSEAQRTELEHLDVWAGPLVGDLGRAPELLLEIARRHAWDAVIIDSLKDLGVRLSEDDGGSAVNRALQFLVADGIDVVALHHQRKGQDGRKPKTLEDVYGSTWITAGAGSVVLLWGEAGSELVELEHLKQPADPVGPWRLEHDHHAGTTVVSRGFDPLAYLAHHPGGATLADIAQAQWGSTPTEAQRKRTERKLRGLAKRNPPLVVALGQDRLDDGGFSSARWAAAAPTFTVDAPVDTTP